MVGRRRMPFSFPEFRGRFLPYPEIGESGKPDILPAVLRRENVERERGRSGSIRADVPEPRPSGNRTRPNPPDSNIRSASVGVFLDLNGCLP